MDTDERTQQLEDEIAEIAELIEKWEPATDLETRWAIYLLKTCLERRQQNLVQLLSTKGNTT